MENTMKRRVELPQGILQAVAAGKQNGLGVEYLPDRVRIHTKASRDPSRSSNGGEYDFWTVVRLKGQAAEFRDACSCDFWQPHEAWTPLNEPFEKVVRAIRRASV
jgi:hypothetical protein